MPSYTHKLIHDHLRTARRPVLIADERIDGDSLGASLAIADYLKRLGKPVVVVVSSEVPEKYRFLPHIELCTADLSVLENREIDLVISFDCSDARYIRGLVERIPKRPVVINIDHHATNSLYGDINMVDVHAPATCEVVHQFYVVNGIIPSKEAATNLLCGIAFDTTIFFNEGTNSRALDAASDLLLHGARAQDVIRMMFRNRSVEALHLWGVALERLREHPELGFISTCITRADLDAAGVSEEEVDGLSDFLNVVVNADTMFVLRETKDNAVKVSMRTSTQNVAAVAKAFGGGGHVKAAGFTVPNARLVCGKDGCWKVAEAV